MLEAASAGPQMWDCALTTTQVKEILDGALRWGPRRVTLISPSGQRYLDVGTPESADASAEPSPADAEAVARAAVQVRGEIVATVETVGPAIQRAVLEQTAQVTALRLAEGWEVASEIDSLASEIVHAYEELHLLYDLGEELTRQMSVAAAADLILARITTTFSTRWAELTLGASDRAAFRKPDADASPPSPGDHLLVSHLRSGGQLVGKITLARSAEAAPFSSVEAKLLDGVGSIAASALHNAQLFEELIRQADALREREAHLNAVVDNVAEGIITVDESGVVESFNLAAEQVFGFQAAEIVGKLFTQIVVPDPSGSAWQPWLPGDARPEVRVTPRGEATGRRHDGTTFLIDLGVSEMRREGRRSFIVSVRDITERKRWEDALKHQALHDGLTDLPNRTLLHDRLAQAILSGQRSSQPLALLIMDLDHFKEVNDTLGHHAGDQLLQQIGPRLRSILRESDTIARLGGDEFAALLPGADPGGAALVALEILQALDRPFPVEGHSLSVGASIGIACCPNHGEDAGTLLRHADVAMYVAKRSHSGYSVYVAERDYHSTSRLELKGELRHAIDSEQLVLYYQPQFELRSGLVVRVEALVRWHHPQRGLVLPAQFISLAEQTGLIDSLSHWVLDTALRQCRMWLETNREVSVAVNLSAQNLHDPRLPDLIERLLEARGVPPSLLKVEITESSLMADPVRALKILTRLSGMGVRIGVDDFGTGYSSLAYLKRLPVHELKIDKSFVLHMARDENDEAIVRSTIGLGHDLGLTVVAEGVETPQTWSLLGNLGCDVAQGYYLGRPIPGHEVSQLLGQAQRGRVPRAVQRERRPSRPRQPTSEPERWSSPSTAPAPGLVLPQDVKVSPEATRRASGG